MTARKARKLAGFLVIMTFLWLALGGWMPGVGWGWH